MGSWLQCVKTADMRLVGKMRGTFRLPMAINALAVVLVSLCRIPMGRAGKCLTLHYRVPCVLIYLIKLTGKQLTIPDTTRTRARMAGTDGCLVDRYAVTLYIIVTA